MNRLLSFFSDKNNYPFKTGEVTHIETHISHVFLTDSLVYKIKKPVKFDFLDFSSLKKRGIYCRREVELNSRLAKGYYLGVERIFEKDGILSFKKLGGSKVFEYAVKMKRINENLILAHLIEKGELIADEIIDVAKRLVSFHRTAMVYKGKYYGGWAAVKRDNDDNIKEIRPYVGKTLDYETFKTVTNYVEVFLRSNRTLFITRKRNGYVKEIHGDLHTNHIVLSKPVVIFDCIEFNRRLGIGDVLEDIGFLLMDLEYRGRFDLSKIVYNTYFCNKNDIRDDELLRFYKVYRAVVRGKVESFLADEIPNDQVKKKAKDYFYLACHYIKSPNKTFNPLIFAGPSGSGKSSVATCFDKEAIILRSDEIRKKLASRKQLFNNGKIESGLYSAGMTELTYKTLLDETLRRLRESKKVIVDATFLKRWQRSLFMEKLMNEGFSPLFVYFTASQQVLAERVARRKKEGTDISDADLNVLFHQLQTMEPLDELPSFRLLKLKNESAIDMIVKNIKELFR